MIKLVVQLQSKRVQRMKENLKLKFHATINPHTKFNFID